MATLIYHRIKYPNVVRNLFCVAAEPVDPAQIKNALLYSVVFICRALYEKVERPRIQTRGRNSVASASHIHITFHLTGIEERNDEKSKTKTCVTHISMLSHRFPSTF